MEGTIAHITMTLRSELGPRRLQPTFSAKSDLSAFRAALDALPGVRFFEETDFLEWDGTVTFFINK